LRGESRIRRDADQGLAEVLPAKHLGESGGDDLKSLADILAVADLAGGDPGCHLGQERVVPLRRILADGEVPHAITAVFLRGGELAASLRTWPPVPETLLDRIERGDPSLRLHWLINEERAEVKG
jgi:hypothetical protein